MHRFSTRKARLRTSAARSTGQGVSEKTCAEGSGCNSRANRRSLRLSLPRTRPPKPDTRMNYQSCARSNFFRKCSTKSGEVLRINFRWSRRRTGPLSTTSLSSSRKLKMPCSLLSSRKRDTKRHASSVSSCLKSSRSSRTTGTRRTQSLKKQMRRWQEPSRFSRRPSHWLRRNGVRVSTGRALTLALLPSPQST